MKKVLLGTILGLVSMGVWAGPASTFSGDINDYNDFKVTNADGTGNSCDMKTSLKVPGSKKDLLIGVSLQSGIMTETRVKGQKGATDFASADGSVEVAVKIDGATIAPGTVVFNSRAQELEATLGGVLDSCTFECQTDMDEFLVDEDGNYVDEDGLPLPEGADPIPNPDYGTTYCTFDADDCLWTDEEIELMLDTTSANHFNFIAPNVGTGEHTIEVCVGLAANATADKASSWAVVNVGSLTVEVVKSANTTDGITIDP